MIKELDSTRLKILEILNEPKTTTEVAKNLKLSKATVSHHLKILAGLNLVKIAKTEVEKNFIKKYYISTLSIPDNLFPQQEKIFEDFKLSKDEFLRVLLRNLTLLNLENRIFLKKIGLDVGYNLLADRIEGRIDEELANLWEKLKLGKVVESTKNTFIVEDCYTCKGLQNIGDTYCKTDEGIIEGILLKKTGDRHAVSEVKCWGTGDEFCLFRIVKI